MAVTEGLSLMQAWWAAPIGRAVGHGGGTNLAMGRFSTLVFATHGITPSATPPLPYPRRHRRRADPEGPRGTWYLDISQRGRDWLTGPVNRLVESAEAEATGQDGVTDAAALAEAEILRLTPFIEQMGPTTDGRRKEFWWEREWRFRPLL